MKTTILIAATLFCTSCSPDTIDPPPMGTFVSGQAAAVAITLVNGGSAPAPDPAPGPSPAPTPSPDRKKCPVCEGAGKIDYDGDGRPDADCVNCNGTGFASMDSCCDEDVPAAVVAIPPINWLTWRQAVDVAGAGTDKPFVIHVSGKYCGPCRLMERNVFTNEAVREAALKFNMVKVDGDSRYSDGATAAAALGVTAYPTDIVTTHKWKLVRRFEGAIQDADYYARRLDAWRDSFDRWIERTGQ